MRTKWAVVAAVMVSASSARAEVKTREVEYKQGETALQGFVAWDDAVKGKRPGVLVVHEWWGHNQHARNQAMRLAKEGYVAFALDMYGKGKLAQHPKDAQAMMEEATKDPKVVGARFEAALAELKKDALVAADDIGVVGYCMGGAIALAMARSGQDLDAVATFHAGIYPPKVPAKKGAVKPRIQVHTGADDPMVPAAAVEGLEKEMAAAGARLEVVRYPGAKHSFTNPEADKAKVDGLAYNADADAKSWAASMKMFKEVFGAAPAQPTR